MDYIGIDIGSTAAKVVARGDHELEFALPTGWSSKETARTIAGRLREDGIDVSRETAKVVATGYGRVAVDYADYVITEITCHARGRAGDGGATTAPSSTWAARIRRSSSSAAASCRISS